MAYNQTIPSLTGIRALAAFLVLLLHADQNIPIGVASAGVLARGYLGVDLFFLLSGFILTFVYFESLRKPTAQAFKIFMWHRFIRLYPVHITVLAALVFVVLMAGRFGLTLRAPEAFTFDTLPWQILLLHGWGFSDRVSWNVPSWSISAEWFAYLCFPLVAACLDRVRSEHVLLLVAVTSLAMAAVVFSLVGWGLADAWIAPSAFVRIGGEFVCGAALCRYAVVRHAIEARSRLNDGIALTALTGFFVGAGFGMPDFALIALLAIFIAALATSDGLASKLFSTSPMVWLGEVSYSLYMIHFPVLRTLNIIFRPERLHAMGVAAAVVAYVLSIVVCVIAAAALYYLIERPLRVRLRNAAGELPRAAPVAAGFSAGRVG